MSLAVVGFDNFWDYAILSGYAASADTSLENLLYDDLSLRWTTPDNLPGNSWIRGYSYYPANLNWFAAIDHNLDARTGLSGFGATGPPTGQWRVRTLDADFFFRKIPDSILGLTNLSGDITALAERNASSIDGVSLTPVNNALPITARIRYTQSGHALNAGTNAQILNINVSKSVQGGSNPTASIILERAGVPFLTLVNSLPIPDGIAGTTISAYFSQGDLLGFDPVDIRITGTSTGSSTLKVNAAIWLPELIPGLGYDYYDSGLLTVQMPVSYRERRPTTLNAIHKAERTVFARTVWIDFFGDGNSSGDISVGRLLSSESVSIVMAADSWNIGWRDPSIEVPMRGGNERFHRRKKRRRASIRVPPAKIDDALADLFDKIQGNIGITDSLLWVFDEDAPDRWPLTAFFGRIPELTDLENISRFFAHGFSVLETR